MLIIEVKDNESIDRALKRYKRKHQRVKLKQELIVVASKSVRVASALV